MVATVKSLLMRRALVRVVVSFAVMVVCCVVVSGAGAAVPWWQLDSVSEPSSLPVGGTATLFVSVSNLGEGEVQASGQPVVVRDVLPAGLEAVSVSGAAATVPAGFIGLRGGVACSLVSGSLVECVFEGSLSPYEQLEVKIEVNVLAGAKSGEVNQASVSGGGVRGAKLERPIVVSSEPTGFGVENYELAPFDEDGSVDTQAGSHPFGLTTTLDLNRSGTAPFFQPEMPKDLHFDLPPGLIGNPVPFPQCTDAQFSRLGEFVNECPEDTAVGVATVTVELSKRFVPVMVPVFNLKPSPGEPAKFGFTALVANVTLDTSVRTGGDYGVTVSVNNITQISPFLGSQVTFWGVPGDPVHDHSRGWQCLGGGVWGLLASHVGPCSAEGQSNPPPFLSLPTSCTGELRTTISADSWEHEGVFTTPLAPVSEPALDGCNRLPFQSSIKVAPDGQAGSSPSGLSVGIHVPQDAVLNPASLAESSVKDTTVTLPAGVALNPAAGDGLQACSEEQVALSKDVFPSCPEASKVGTVEIKTPLLPNPLVGAAYLAAQDQNPFGSLVALYIVAEDPVSGTLVKVAGEVKPDPVTGQLVSTFDDTPQLPFEDLTLHFFGGSRAPLGTPALCGGYTTRASIAPWSGNAPSEPSSEFQITSGPNGSPCRNPLLFSPSLTVGSTNIQAGAFTPFTTTMSREDGQQNLQGIVLHMPPGVSGLLSGVALCGEAQANAGTCGPGSLIGETIVSVGLGGSPYSVKGGKVYITGPYKGAPFGLSIVNPAKAGPYDLGQVVVRAKIEVDPVTAALTITTDDTGPYRIPTIIDGIPLQIQHVNVLINRPGFTFNPTDCNPMSITGSLVSTEGAVQGLSVPFQVTNCATLGFKPSFKVSTSGRTSRAKGASLDVKLSYPKAAFGSQANIAKVKVDLPKQLPSRLTTLQKACPDSTFDQNPAACPAASRVGTAVASTPLIPVALEGPAYFVSHGGAKFPELIVVLSGYGVTVQLHGETFIDKAGITSSTFRTIPDVPVGTFELKLPQGSNSALAAIGNLCKSTLKMPTAFTAQNGMTLKQSTPITVTGCAKHKAKKVKRAKKGKRSGRARHG
jgi:uncharacterized repeat protein (TIGR01451 family)